MESFEFCSIVCALHIYRAAQLDGSVLPGKIGQQRALVMEKVSLGHQVILRAPSACPSLVPYVKCGVLLKGLFHVLILWKITILIGRCKTT